MFLIIITFLTAFIISGIAAYFSIIGLATLFAATFIPVIIMGTSLEVGKIVATVWLHENIKNKNISILIKSYLIMAVAVLMLITATGIYGFLSKGHLEQTNPLSNVELQISHLEQSIKFNQDIINSEQQKLKQLDDSIEVYFKNNQVTRGLQARKSQETERKLIQENILKNNTEIQTIQQQITELKGNTLEVEAKLGPIKYVSALFGWEDTEYAVRLVILMIMFAFDPLAIALIIAGNNSLKLRKNKTLVGIIEKNKNNVNNVDISSNNSSSINDDLEIEVTENVVENTTKKKSEYDPGAWIKPKH